MKTSHLRVIGAAAASAAALLLAGPAVAAADGTKAPQGPDRGAQPAPGSTDCAGSVCLPGISKLPGLLNGLAGGPGGAAPKVQKCNEETKSGGNEVTSTRHIIGRSGPTSFSLTYRTYTVKDAISVWYEGKRIYNSGPISTGGHVGDGPSKTVSISVPAGRSSEVLVKVDGTVDPNNAQGTRWDYKVSCPA